MIHEANAEKILKIKVWKNDISSVKQNIDLDTRGLKSFDHYNVRSKRKSNNGPINDGLPTHFYGIFETNLTLLFPEKDNNPIVLSEQGLDG